MLSLLLAAALFPAQAKPTPAPENLKARAVSETNFVFVQTVFDTPVFPAGVIHHAPALKDLFGSEAEPEIAVRFYGTDLKLVARPEKAGPYAAVVKITAKGERPLVRFVTLYRSAKLPPKDPKYGPENREAFARDMGLNVEVVKRNGEVIDRVIRGRPLSAWIRDPYAARLLTGLFLSKPAKESAHKYDDGLAVERQWWVDLKRTRVYPEEKTALKRFVAPTLIKGEPARVVRIGTEEEAGVKKGTADKIDAVLQAFAKDTDQAFAVCIVRRGVIVLHKAYGTRDGKPMTVDTPSWMASVTKTMSATLMLMLIDQGFVKMDDPVEKYLPCLRGIKVQTPLTIRHLYTHTNGLTLDGFPAHNDELHDVAERISAYYDRLRVGKEWHYTGTGNMLGSKIFEAITGEALPVAYQKHLFGPLGCTNTHVTDSHAGGFSIPLDMAKFAQMLLNGGSYGNQRFFREEMFTKMLPGSLEKLLGPGAKRRFGFGLDGSPTKFGHGAASGATFHIDREHQLVVIMTRNKFGKNQDKFNGRMWKVIDEGILKEK